MWQFIAILAMVATVVLAGVSVWIWRELHHVERLLREAQEVESAGRAHLAERNKQLMRAIAFLAQSNGRVKKAICERLFAGDSTRCEQELARYMPAEPKEPPSSA